MARFGSLGTQYFDNSGNILSGGSVAFYTSGSSVSPANLITVYSDSGLATPITNPVTLDSYGRQPSIFFNGNAKGVLRTSADVILQTLDPVGDTSATFQFQLYDSARTYSQYDIVQYGGLYYQSLQNSNLAHTPGSSPTYWALYFATLGSTNTFTAAQNFADSVTIASASSVAIGAAASNNVVISGTTTITSFDTLTGGAWRLVRFSGALTLTHNATSLILPTGANITTAAGDTALFLSEGSGNWRCMHYQRKDGTALVGSTPTAAQGASMVLLSTLTPSGSSTIDIETTFSSTYDVYLITAVLTQSVDSNDLWALFKLSGSYATANYRYASTAVNSGSSGYFGSASAADSAILIHSAFGSGSTSGLRLTMWVFNPASTSQYKNIKFDAVGNQDAGNVYVRTGVGSNDGTGALTGIRLKNVAVPGTLSGTVCLYGLKKS